MEGEQGEKKNGKNNVMVKSFSPLSPVFTSQCLDLHRSFYGPVGQSSGGLLKTTKLSCSAVLPVLKCKYSSKTTETCPY